jgi:Kef-type K+ transport system membrane component KefB
MPDVSFTNLLIICAVAVSAPMLVGLLPWVRIPAVVLEIVAGIVLGPSVLGWLHVDLPVQILALFGLAFLLFLAGLEIDTRRLRGRVLMLAGAGYLITVVLGTAAGLGFHAVGWVGQPLLLAIALSATSLGLVVPVLKDAGVADGTVGQTAIAAASVADFAAIVLLSLFFSTSGGSTGAKVVFLVAFAAVVAATGVTVAAAGRSRKLGDVLVRLQDTTAEIRVRFAVVLLVAFTALAERFGLESILGAFLAGAVVGMVDRDATSHPNFRTKLEAIGYGFLVPVFFISSGVRLDLRALLSHPAALARVPLFLLALLVVRGVPALLNLRAAGPRATAAVGLLQATSLPFIVTATQIGLELGQISAVTAAALVCAGLLSVLLFPPLALALLRNPSGTSYGAGAEPLRAAKQRPFRQSTRQGLPTELNQRL